MYTATYQERRSCMNYAAGVVIGYLNEKVVENYVSEQPDGENPVTWQVAYQYTGTMPDGGTLMKCSEAGDYGEMTNAIIRTRYSESEETAMHRHRLQMLEQPECYSEEKAEAYNQEWADYNKFCEEAKAIAKNWTE